MLYITKILNHTINHHDEDRFLSWLREAIVDYYEHWSREEINKLPMEGSIKDLRSYILNHEEELGSLFDYLHYQFWDTIDRTFAVKVASADYDGYGPAHSGYNKVIDVFGLYFLRGSDFNKGPFKDLRDALDYLALDGESTDTITYEIYKNEDYEEYFKDLI